MPLTTPAERNFNSFYLGDNPYELADGLLRQMAETVGVRIADEQDPSAIERLRSTVEVRGAAPWTSLELGRMIKSSGVYMPLDRSLDNPINQTPDTAIRVVVGTEAEQQDRVADLLVTRPEDAAHSAVIVATSDKELSSKRGIANTNVKRFADKHDRLPTASEYASRFVVPRLQEAHYVVDQLAVDTEQEHEVVKALAEQEGRLRVCNVVTVETSAVAGIHLAVRLRTALRKHYPRFDHTNRKTPQLYMLTNGRPLHENGGRPQDASRTLLGITVIAKALSEAALADR